VNKNIIFTGNVPYNKVKYYISLGYLSISPIPPIPPYLISSPTKVIEGLGLGIPVIANSEIQDQYSVIKESNGGISVPYNIELFTKAIQKIINNSSLRENMAKNGKKYIKDIGHILAWQGKLLI